jgi:hypothetical protein
MIKTWPPNAWGILFLPSGRPVRGRARSRPLPEDSPLLYSAAVSLAAYPLRES